MSTALRMTIARPILVLSRQTVHGARAMSSEGNGRSGAGIHEGLAPQRPPFSSAAAFRCTEPPNPDWKYGESYEGAVGAEEWKKEGEQGYKSIDTSTASPRDIYPLMISGIIPRPIAFVSSLSATGVPNLAPFSYFSMVSHNPPLVSVSFLHPRHKEKDTSENIRATKGFTVNIISEPFVSNANFTSIDAPEDVDEWTGSGLTREPSTIVKPPRVKESAFSMECELFHLHDISPPGSTKVTGTLVLGHVKMFHVRNAILNNKGIIDTAKLRAVSRLGGLTYGRVGDSFDLPRLSWKTEKGVVESLKERQ